MPIFIPPTSGVGGGTTIIVSIEVSTDSKVFHYTNLLPNEVNLPIFSEEGIIGNNYVTIPYAGSIIGAELETLSTTPLIAGIVTMRPTINGVPLGSALLDAELSIADTIRNSKTVGVGTYTFIAESWLGVVVTSSVGLLPALLAIKCTLYLRLTTP